MPPVSSRSLFLFSTLRSHTSPHATTVSAGCGLDQSPSWSHWSGSHRSPNGPQGTTSLGLGHLNWSLTPRCFFGDQISGLGSYQYISVLCSLLLPSPLFTLGLFCMLFLFLPFSAACRKTNGMNDRVGSGTALLIDRGSTVSSSSKRCGTATWTPAWESAENDAPYAPCDPATVPLVASCY